MRLSQIGTLATVRPIVAALDDDDDHNDDDDYSEYASVDGMRIGKGNQSTQRKPAPVPLFPSQIPHNMIWYQTQTTMGN
jgi:hypothetical protein